MFTSLLLVGMVAFLLQRRSQKRRWTELRLARIRRRFGRQ